jgi:hypothetical protein
MSELIPFEKMLPAAQGWTLLKEQSEELIKSGFLPSGIKTGAQAVAIILKGRELGIPPMQALSHIHVINGKPTMSAELMLSQIMRLHPRTRISYPERSNERCEMKVTREGCEPSTFVFTIEDATRAGVMGNPTWKKYPRAMLHARCVSEMARSLFPDAISGVSYTAEELGANVDENGEVIDVEASESKGSVVSDTVDKKPLEASNANATAGTAQASKPASQVPMFDEGNALHAKSVMQWCEQKQYKNVYRSMIEAMKGQPFTRVGFDTAWGKVNPEAPDKEPDNV